jgi:transposase InsO family protein
MDNNDEKIALFKFKIIAPVLNEPELNQKAYFKKMAEKEYNVPHFGTKRFSHLTFKKWLYWYRKKGFEGLKPSYRKDKGASRKVDEKLLHQIKHLVQTYQFRTVKNLYDYLIQENHIGENDFTYATLNNFIKSKDIFTPELQKKARKSYEVEHINELWVTDFMYGPYVKQGKKNIRTYLCSILDDCSRFIVSAKFFTTMSNLSFELTLKTAISTFGMPNKIYCDNGKVYLHGHIPIIAAKLGFIIIHSKPYDAASRGKIERHFRTVRDKFIPFYHIRYKDQVKTLENLNRDFEKWLDEKYHRVRHSGIKAAPFDKYFSGLEKITVRKTTPQKLHNAFMHIKYRRVNNDSTVLINNVFYEAPPKYIGKKIQIRYPIDNINDYYIFENDVQICQITKLNRNLNAQFPIRFRDIDENDDDKLRPVEV